MYQGEEGRKAYEESCRNKCCSGHGNASVDNGGWDVAGAAFGKDGLPYGSIAPSVTQLVDILKDVSSGVAKQAAKETALAQHIEAHRQTSIRIVFLDGTVHDIPSDGRDLRLAEYKGNMVVMDHGREESVGTVKQCDVAYIPMNQVKMILRIAK